LVEDVGSSNEADSLLPVVKRLQRWAAPAPTLSDTATLSARLKSALPARGHPSLTADHSLPWPLLLIRAQLRVVRGEIWAASAMVLALGALVTLAMSAPGASAATLPFVFVAPLVAAVGVAFLYGPGVDPPLEIELATPVSPRLTLLARLTLVFGFDLGLGLVASLALAVMRADLTFWPLVSAWLAPMAFLSALAFLLTVLSLDAGLGVLVSLGLWGLHSAAHLQVANSVPLPISLPDLTMAAAQPWLWMSALLLSAAALWIGGREEHWLRRAA
jgi:hypothetical protein